MIFQYCLLYYQQHCITVTGQQWQSSIWEWLQAVTQENYMYIVFSWFCSYTILSMPEVIPMNGASYFLPYYVPFYFHSRERTISCENCIMTKGNYSRWVLWHWQFVLFRICTLQRWHLLTSFAKMFYPSCSMMKEWEDSKESRKYWTEHPDVLPSYYFH